MSWQCKVECLQDLEMWRAYYIVECDFVEEILLSLQLDIDRYILDHEMRKLTKFSVNV